MSYEQFLKVHVGTLQLEYLHRCTCMKKTSEKFDTKSLDRYKLFAVLILSHDIACFQCNITITYFLILHMLDIMLAGSPRASL